MKSNIECYSPEYVLKEIVKYKEMILERSKLTSKAYDDLFEVIFAHINLIPKSLIKSCIDESFQLIADKDPKDILYLVSALCLNIDIIWTNDQDYIHQNKIKIMNTSELMQYFNLKSL